jgi:hypothetical protein
MDAFVKSFATYRTIKKAPVLSSALVLDSLDADTSTVTVKGTEIGRSDTGNWLIVDGNIYQISAVKPQKDRTMLTLVSPMDAFNRTLEFDEQVAHPTAGAFVADVLQKNWVTCDDPVYSVNYLVVSDSDTTPYTPPELDSNGCFALPAYCRLLRKSYRTAVTFRDAGELLICSISRIPEAVRKISFEDGNSQLQSVDYSKSGTAKLTVLQDVDTGVKDDSGNAILRRDRSVWYLAEDGSISQVEPARRAVGKWATIVIKGAGDVRAKVIETFAKNKANHKLEFWSTRDLNVQDACTFMVYGDVLQSYISYKRKSSEDKRFYYKSGELATTATEKLRGATK